MTRLTRVKSGPWAVLTYLERAGINTDWIGTMESANYRASTVQFIEQDYTISLNTGAAFPVRRSPFPSTFRLASEPGFGQPLERHAVHLTGGVERHSVKHH